MQLSNAIRSLADYYQQNQFTLYQEGERIRLRRSLGKVNDCVKYVYWQYLPENIIVIIMTILGPDLLEEDHLTLSESDEEG